MNNSISYYAGINPKPKKKVLWTDVLTEIGNGTYKKLIEKARAIKDPDKYRDFKTTLPSVTFSGTFNGRRAANAVLTTTGLIIADLDHLPNVDDLFKSIIQDEKILFAFRSPGGEGIKAGIRTNGIRNDEDHKIFYNAVERYFRVVYGIDTDPSCKDISRLTFLSYDPDIWINPTPLNFKVKAWADASPLDNDTPDNGITGKEKYAAKVLESACAAIRDSVQGNQHAVRLAKSRLVGGYLQYMDEEYALSELENAVRASGAKHIDRAMKTVREGMANGKLSPIYLENTTNATDVTDVTDVTEHDRTRQNTTPHDRHDSQNRRFEGNLTSEIETFVKDNQGVFSVSDIDREFGLVHRFDKQNRSRALQQLVRKNKLIKDRRAAGKYHIIQDVVEWIDIEDVNTNYFDMDLPLHLTDMVNIPPKCICVIAGTSNSGKTALMMDILKRNIHKQYKKVYLMSEMGPSEYAGRVKKKTDNIKEWKDNIKSASVTSGFDGVIANNNKNGMTVIDFLEEVEGEYFKITSDIRSIYDALGDGIAWVALQKHSKSNVGRGGEGTTEKARLYLTMDVLLHQPNHTIVAVKIIKAKDYPGENPNGKEIHVKIIGGHRIEPIEEFDGWQYCNEKQRAVWVKRYEHMVDRGINAPAQGDKEIVVSVYLDEGYGYVNRGTLHKWQEAFQNIDVLEELEKISHASNNYKKMMNKKDWFFRVSQTLENINKKMGSAMNEVPF